MVIFFRQILLLRISFESGVNIYTALLRVRRSRREKWWVRIYNFFWGEAVGGCFHYFGLDSVSLSIYFLLNCFQIGLFG